MLDSCSSRSVETRQYAATRSFGFSSVTCFLLPTRFLAGITVIVFSAILYLAFYQTINVCGLLEWVIVSVGDLSYNKGGLCFAGRWCCPLPDSSQCSGTAIPLFCDLGKGLAVNDCRVKIIAQVMLVLEHPFCTAVKQSKPCGFCGRYQSGIWQMPS